MNDIGIAEPREATPRTADLREFWLGALFGLTVALAISLVAALRLG